MQYLFKLVFATTDKNWLRIELREAINLAKTKEPETPAQWIARAEQKAENSRNTLRYLLFSALLTMNSMRQRTGVTEKDLEFASKQFQAMIQGSEGGPQSVMDLMDRLCSYYTHY